MTLDRANKSFTKYRISGASAEQIWFQKKNCLCKMEIGICWHRLLRNMLKIVVDIQIFWSKNILSIWVFLSQTFTIHRTAGKRRCYLLISLYHFYPIHWHLDIGWAITVDSSPLHIASWTRNHWFPRASH